MQDLSEGISHKNGNTTTLVCLMPIYCINLRGFGERKRHYTGKQVQKMHSVLNQNETWLQQRIILCINI
jgi:hypothetical protein